MNEYGCGSSGVWKILSDIPLYDVVLSVYFWDFLQVELCAVVYYCSTGVDWSLDQIEDLQSVPRTSQMVLSRFWMSMAIIHDNLDIMVQEWPQGISQESSQCYLKYEVGDILDEF